VPEGQGGRRPNGGGLWGERSPSHSCHAVGCRTPRTLYAGLVVATLTKSQLESQEDDPPRVEWGARRGSTRTSHLHRVRPPKRYRR
jgi:hypothetical protein